MVDALDAEHREVVRQAVIAEVVAERPFGLADVGVDGADDHEIGLGGHRQARRRAATIRTRRPAQGPGEAQLGQALGQRHHGGDRQGRRAADEDVDPQRLAPPDRRRVVDADPAMDLVVQADLAVRLVLVPRELDPVHPQVRLRQAGAVGVLGVDLRQRDERPAVVAATTGAGAAGSSVV